MPRETVQDRSSTVAEAIKHVFQSPFQLLEVADHPGLVKLISLDWQLNLIVMPVQVLTFSPITAECVRVGEPGIHH